MNQSIPNIPPLAGICSYERAAVPGYSVEENVQLLRRYNWVEKRLYELMAAFMNPTPQWEVKCAFSLHMYLDAEHASTIRGRVAELRKPPHHLDVTPDEKLEAALGEAFYSRGTVELLTAIFRVIRPALLAAYESHQARTNPVFEHPTYRLLRIAIEEEREAIQWGESALSAAIGDDPGAAQISGRWAEHLSAYLSAAGGINGMEPIGDRPVPASRSTGEPFVPDIDPKRDSRCGDIYNFCYRPNDVYQDSEASFEERTLALMYKRYHEMDVPELMASIIAQTPGKPWEYYREMARQLWDEARHAMMGEVWFVSKGIPYTRFPNHVGWSLQHNLECTPLERHLMLYHIEQSLMHGQTGKKFEWEISKHTRDPLAIYFQDYDWADEVLHAQIGRRWLGPGIGDASALMEKAKVGMDRPKLTAGKRAVGHPQVDWWPDFVLAALGKPSTARPGEAYPTVREFEKASG